jgi:LAO/AO transport system kinase
VVKISKNKTSFQLPEYSNYRKIGQLLTKIEQGELKFDREQENFIDSKGEKNIILGVTGGSGAGKSTFINSFIKIGLIQKKKIAVLVIDPTSESDGGTFLGDRLRLDPSYPESGVFIRSIASSGAKNEIPESVHSMLVLLRNIGYELLIVETVGIGQAEAQIKKYVDKLVFIPSPDLEDWVQAVKNEALINADIVFINQRSKVEINTLETGIRDILASRNDSKTSGEVFKGSANDYLDLQDLYQFLTTSVSSK